MQLPDFNQQLAGDRQARYRADAAMSRLPRPDRSGDGRVSRSVSARRPTDPVNQSNSVLGREIRRPSFGCVAIAHVDQQVPKTSADEANPGRRLRTVP
jgi:hypothetical protein